MQACGLVVEYNPFHNGHHYHVQEAKRISGADCMIAVMSGSFLQRGEPAIIDKYYRARAALAGGVDLILELPYPYAVQSSEWFAKGAVQTLYEAGVTSICFGSEDGVAASFISAYEAREQHAAQYQAIFKSELAKGLSFPMANKAAYEAIGLDQGAIDLTKPNNILGYSYVKEILDNKLNIKPMTIKRKNNDYHDEQLNGNIASATSIRKALFTENQLDPSIKEAITEQTAVQLQSYRQTTGIWHDWEAYFPILHYKVMVTEPEELATFHGVDEGLEYRIKQTAAKAHSMHEWLSLVKTKRYTWTRLQRAFVHILTHTKKTDMEQLKAATGVSYVRVLGMTETGRSYLNKVKKQIRVPLITRIYQGEHLALKMEANATQSYYSVLTPTVRETLFHQEQAGPLRVR